MNCPTCIRATLARNDCKAPNGALYRIGLRMTDSARENYQHYTDWVKLMEDMGDLEDGLCWECGGCVSEFLVSCHIEDEGVIVTKEVCLRCFTDQKRHGHEESDFPPEEHIETRACHHKGECKSREETDWSQVDRLCLCFGRCCLTCCACECAVKAGVRHEDEY